jgi:hypothetical protein
MAAESAVTPIEHDQRAFENTPARALPTILVLPGDIARWILIRGDALPRGVGDLGLAKRCDSQ